MDRRRDLYIMRTLHQQIGGRTYRTTPRRNSRTKQEEKQTRKSHRQGKRMGPGGARPREKTRGGPVLLFFFFFFFFSFFTFFLGGPTEERTGTRLASLYHQWQIEGTQIDKAVRRSSEIRNSLTCHVNDLHHIEIITYDFLKRLQSWLAENKKADIWLHKI